MLLQFLQCLKVISKKLIKKKNHVSYIKSEREILTKVSRRPVSPEISQIAHPFIVNLKFAFASEKKLFLVFFMINNSHLRR